MNCNKLSLESILGKISRLEPFEAVTVDHSAYIKIEQYVSFVCLSIHNGNQLRPEMAARCLLSPYERWFEEDPRTYDFIDSMPIVFSALDSRYEYDLNRDIHEAVYKVAWGKTVWNETLPQAFIDRSLEKHKDFYVILQALLDKLDQIYKHLLVFDIHSYNYKRINRETPVFDIGSILIRKDKYAPVLSFFEQQLGNVILPNIMTTVAQQSVFEGQGYLSVNLNARYTNILVFVLEIKKIYCDEENGTEHDSVIKLLAKQLKKVILNTADRFNMYHNTTQIIN